MKKGGSSACVTKQRQYKRGIRIFCQGWRGCGSKTRRWVTVSWFGQNNRWEVVNSMRTQPHQANQHSRAVSSYTHQLLWVTTGPGGLGEIRGPGYVILARIP